MRVLYPGRIGIWTVSFWAGRKTGEPGEIPRSKDENQQQIQPTYDTGPELNSGHIGGRRAHCKKNVLSKNTMMSPAKARTRTVECTNRDVSSRFHTIHVTVILYKSFNLRYSLTFISRLIFMYKKLTAENIFGVINRPR